MPPTPEPEVLATARFRTVKTAEPIEVVVHFNPASLQYTVANTLKDPGRGGNKKQYVSQTTAKLTMDLVFDTTATGEDVRETTNKMVKLLKPHGPSGKQVPPRVEFGWGVYRFTGMVEQYKETLEFFAAGGVPLRSTVNLTLCYQDKEFPSARTNPRASVDQDVRAETVRLPTSTGPAGGPAAVANALGDPRAARAIAAANGSASLRFSAGADLAVGGEAGVTLGAAAAFSAGAGAGIGLAAGAGIGLSAGAGPGMTVGAGGGLGSSAGAAFSGLRASVSTPPAMPDPSVALSLTGGAAAGTGAQFGLGGRAKASGSASLSADVGAGADLDRRLKFGD
jgi:hypothetical protein